MRTLALCFLALLIGQDKPKGPAPHKTVQKESAAPSIPANQAEQSSPKVKEPAPQTSPEAPPNHRTSVLERAVGPDTWPTWALVLVGVWAARIAIRTLRAIEHEAEIATKIADAAKENALAAKANALALIIENRPWLLIDKVELPYLTPAVEVASKDQRFAHCFVMTKNHGKTPAKVVKLWAVMQMSDSPMKPGTDLKAQIGQTVPLAETFIFPPGEIKAAEARLTPQGFISPDDRDAILKNKTKYLWFCGFVKYEDTFEREQPIEYETRFCYLYETRLNTPEPFWTLAGPPEYNGAT